MIVIDASALVVGVVEVSNRARSVRDAARAGTVAPVIVDAEIGQGLRGLVRRGQLDPIGGLRALRLATRLVSARRRLAGLLGRAWALRDNVSFYDALYVALAEGEGLTLLTADARLAAASGPRCRSR